MIILQKSQLCLLRQKINEMIAMLRAQNISASAKFLPALQIISNNIKTCTANDFDGIKELSGYVYEDWRSVCLGKNGIENWYLDVSDWVLKENWNKAFEKMAISVDHILGTDFIIPRKWYSCDELAELGRRYKADEKEWNKDIEELVRLHSYYPSPISQVPDDIWSFAKMLCPADSDDGLKEWFFKDILAFGYLSAVHILKIKNGDNILRVLMHSISTILC